MNYDRAITGFRHPLKMSSACLATVVLLALLLGCWRDSMVPIGGVVEMDGAPIPQGTIQFIPADGAGPSAEAAIQNGRYQVTLARGNKKVLVRGYKVVGELHPWGKDAPSAPQLKSIVPPRYNDQTELTQTIEKSHDHVDFKLRSQ